MLNPLTGKTIFVQIASFRDSQLLPTLHDMIDKADEPENLRICICWQHSEEDYWDHLMEFEGDDRFTIIDVDAKDSKGVCWARNLIQQEYDDEGCQRINVKLSKVNWLRLRKETGQEIEKFIELSDTMI